MNNKADFDSHYRALYEVNSSVDQKAHVSRDKMAGGLLKLKKFHTNFNRLILDFNLTNSNLFKTTLNGLCLQLSDSDKLNTS